MAFSWCFCLSKDSEPSSSEQNEVPSVDARLVAICYLLLAFSCRVVVRSPSCALHWAVVMAIEDGLSILSFTLGLLYLHQRDGEPIDYLVKCLSITSPNDDADGYADIDPEPLRLFYFAL
mmetsp:Transcript_26053/g.72857  ORF Transcript_26053/g.72857 Transcript_26053/m.72857 type:complete len:120 (+) Transcript_26053:105-464(+)